MILQRIISNNIDKFMLLLLAVIVVTEILDISINKTYLFIRSPQFSAYWDMPLFISVAIVYIIAQYFILKYVERYSHANVKLLSTIHKIVKLAQYSLIAILLVTISQMMITSHYNSGLVISSIWIGYGSAIFMLGFLTKLFIHWFISNRSIITLLYTLAVGCILTAVGISLTLNTLLIGGQPADIQRAGSLSAAIPNNIMPLNMAFIMSSLVAFILTWIATAALLRHHSKRLGRTKYWIVISLPLVYFLIQFQPLFDLLVSVYGITYTLAIVYTIIIAASKPVGGILFAAEFWSMAKKTTDRKLKACLIISAYGVALIFGSDQASILTNRPYPPFGLASITFFGLASYLVLIGIYYSAISMSQDLKLRKSIRNLAAQESQLLDQIGMANMKRHVEKLVLKVTKEQQENLTQETGVQSSLNEQDMKEYLAEVLKEVSKTRKI